MEYFCAEKTNFAFSAKNDCIFDKLRSSVLLIFTVASHFAENLFAVHFKLKALKNLVKINKI